jgi:hypothetical protein
VVMVGMMIMIMMMMMTGSPSSLPVPPAEATSTAGLLMGVDLRAFRAGASGPPPDSAGVGLPTGGPRPQRPRDQQRLIVIDGPNVAMRHGSVVVMLALCFGWD